MIEIICNETLYTYNAYHVTKAFFPDAEICQRVDEKQEPLITVKIKEGSCFSITSESVKAGTADRQEQKRQVTKRLYEYLCEQTGKELAWGMLTGVRPTKLVMQKLEVEMDEKMCIRDRDAIIAVLVATICMLLYIWFRFKDIRFATSAVLALVHDVLVAVSYTHLDVYKRQVGD